LGILFLSSSLIGGYVLVVTIDDTINARINIIIRRFRKLPSEGEEGRFVRTSVYDADATVGDWLEEFFFL